MRVLLVQPPLQLHYKDIPQFGHPLGLAYIAAYLRQAGHEVAILDCLIPNIQGRRQMELVSYGLEWEEIKRRIAEFQPQVVGISAMFTAQEPAFHRLAKIAKELDEATPVILGGAHASALPQQVLQDKNVDFVVIGEGEQAALDLVRHLEQAHPLEAIDGLAYRRNGEVIVHPKANFITNLDELPFPAWDLLDMERYRRLKLAYGPLVKNLPFFSLSSSRGCPLICMFCAIHTVWGYGWRGRSPQKVVDEIENLNRGYGVKEIYFVDDNLLYNKKRMEAICDEILERGLKISWGTPNGVNINYLERGLLKKMKASGCFFLCFGIESGNEFIRSKVIRKPISVKRAKEVVRWCRELNIWTSGCFIIGLPGESPPTFQETINFCKELDMDSASFFVSRLVPGTDLWDQAHQKGYIENSPDLKARATLHLIHTETFAPQDLERWAKRAYRSFAWHILKRELLRLNLLRRLLKVRSIGELRLYSRILARFLKRFYSLS